MDIRIVITDIDGVWTDGGMYYSEQGDELKKFNTSDSAGVLFCRMNDIEVVILTGEDTQIVARRAEKLQIEHVHQGIQKKLAVARSLLDRLGFSFEQAAFIGDGMTDVPLLQAVAYAGSVPNARPYVRRHADYVTEVEGGNGAFRDFVEHLLSREQLLDDTVERFVRDRS